MTKVGVKGFKVMSHNPDNKSMDPACSMSQLGLCERSSSEIVSRVVFFMDIAGVKNWALVAILSGGGTIKPWNSIIVRL